MLALKTAAPFQTKGREGSLEFIKMYCQRKNFMEPLLQ
jgi:hypothetical protein